MTRTQLGHMATKRHARQELVDQANKLRDRNFQLNPRQWQRAIFTLRQRGHRV